jgi:NAD(P)-dependent dehydrogenase (short-subunit alcohol dehydrogenase family)
LKFPDFSKEGSMSLKNRNAVVTGSTSGIGLAYAKALAGEGVNVMINGRECPGCGGIRTQAI